MAGFESFCIFNFVKQQFWEGGRNSSLFSLDEFRISNCELQIKKMKNIRFLIISKNIITTLAEGH